MSTRTTSRSPFETSLSAVAGQLVERAAALPAQAGKPQVVRWLLVIGALFLAWRAWRGFKSLFWVAFGIGMMLYWTGMWRAIF